jgi:hypothetical protein
MDEGVSYAYGRIGITSLSSETSHLFKARSGGHCPAFGGALKLSLFKAFQPFLSNIGTLCIKDGNVCIMTSFRLLVSVVSFSAFNSFGCFIFRLIFKQNFLLYIINLFLPSFPSHLNIERTERFERTGG